MNVCNFVCNGLVVIEVCRVWNEGNPVLLEKYGQKGPVNGEKVVILHFELIYKSSSMIPIDISTGWKTTIMVLAMIAVFYLFLIRPQSQKEKKEKAYRDALQKGDRVMTAGGIHVTIVSKTAGIAIVEAAQGIQMKVQLATLQPIPQPKRK